MRLPLARAWATAAYLAAACGNDAPPSEEPEECAQPCDSGLTCLDGRCAIALDRELETPAPAPVEVTLVAVGLNPDIEELTSVEAFDAYIEAEVERSLQGVAVDERTMLVFPEDIGLLAFFVGDRAVDARAIEATGEGTIIDGLVALWEDTSAASELYQERASATLGLGVSLGLAVTDTLWRTMESFARVARERGVWVATTYNVADATFMTDSELTPMLVDESVVDPTGAWVADAPEVFNQTFFYDPTGVLVMRHKKEYLIALEEDAVTGLGLSYGGPDALRPFATPRGSVASVISRDAWQPDVLDRLVLEDVDILLQPEAWQRWSVTHDDSGAWGPDVVKESFWASVMRYPEVEASVFPCLSTNLYDLAFECQSAIAVDPHLADRSEAFIGQEPDEGLVRVAPWAFEEPTGDRAQRRDAIRALGASLEPGGDAADAYADGSVSYRTTLGAGWPSNEPTDSALAPSEHGQQRRVALALMDDGAAYALWEDDRSGTARLYGARLRHLLGEARPRIATRGEVRAPAIAASRGWLHATWQERRDEHWRVFYARSENGGRSFTEPVPVADPMEGGDQWVPAIAADASRVVIAWVEKQGRPMRVRIAERPSAAAGEVPFSARFVEEAPALRRFHPRINQWDPAVAVRGQTTFVAWTDKRNDRWEIWGAALGTADETVRELSGLGGIDHLTIPSDPTWTMVDGRPLLAWTDLRRRDEDFDPRVRRFDASLGPASEGIALSASDARRRPQWRPRLASRGKVVVAVWQDFREDQNEIRYAISTDAGESFGDDVALVTAAEAFRPNVIVRWDEALVVYESTASGRLQLEVARISMP